MRGDYEGYAPYEPLNECDNESRDTWSSSAAASHAHTAPGGRAHRNRSRIIRWLILHSSGEKKILTLDKRHVIQTFDLDIPNRDMRLMDTHLVNYDTIGQLLVRDNALVLSMEHVRMIIMSDKVILPLEEVDRGGQRDRFVLLLEHLLLDRKGSKGIPQPRTGKGPMPHFPPSPPYAQGCRDMNGKLGGTGNRAPVHDSARGSKGGSSEAKRQTMCGIASNEDTLHSDGATSDTHAEEEEEEDLPFELRVLEAALGEICYHLASEVETLQSRAQPAVEEMTRRADHETLELVRRIKAVRQRLVTRVGLVREILERLTEDDGDMWRMCLTRQLQQRQQRETAAALAASWVDTSTVPAASPALPEESVSASGSQQSSEEATPISSSPLPLLSPLQSSLRGHDTAGRSLRRHGSDEPNRGLVHMASGVLGPQFHMDGEEYHDLLDVENMLESYFMLVDSTYQTVISLGEYIEDTEDLINIQLDASRNSLIRFEIMLSAGTFSLAVFAAVAGALGENLVLPDSITQDLWGFVLVNGFALAACFTIVGFIYSALKNRKLI